MNKPRMKRATLVAMSTAALVLTGCANMDSSHEYVMDSQKVYQVQQAARTSANHVDIIWVNPPQKRVEKK